MQPRGKVEGFLLLDSNRWECKLSSWNVWLQDVDKCHNVVKEWSTAKFFLSHYCNCRKVAITLEGIYFLPVGGFKGTASRWLHIISGLYTALLKFRKKYVTSYTVHSRQVREYKTIHSYSEEEQNSINQKLWRDHEREYFDLRMDFHYQVDACASDAREIHRLLNLRDYHGIRRLRLRQS